MQCPKCEGAMEQIHNPYADYEQCTQCKGLWLDVLEEQDLKEVADAIDDGDPKVGKQYNEQKIVYCPSCRDTQMLRMVDPGQPHIWFESCPSCYGRFYDAGEFSDLSDHSIADFIKSFFAKERK